MTERTRCPNCGQQKPTKRHLLLQLDARTQEALTAQAKALGVSRHRAAMNILRWALWREMR